MPERPVAVLDANVLFPFQLRNLLLHLAAEDLFQPLWSNDIMSELGRVLRDRAGVTDGQWHHLAGQMRRYFGHAWGEGYGGAADGLVLPDEGDRHVLALAVHYEAEFIVTWNLRDFPGDVLLPLGVEAVDPDAFIEMLWEEDRPAVMRAAEQHRVSLRSHPLSPEAYLASLP
jgi:predicted nucleic acid-binding protein